MTALYGFTLIELLVVVLIVGVLAAVAVPQYTLAVERARVGRMLPLFRGILEAQKRYEMANGAITTDLDEMDISLPYKIKENLDGTRTRYTFTSDAYGAELRISVIGAVFWNSGKGYVIDYFGGPAMGKSLTGECYPSVNGSAAERVCKSFGTDVNGNHKYQW